MTVAATYTRELTVAQIIRRAFQVAGVLYSGHDTDADDEGMARDFLGLEMDALQADGVVLRFSERTTQALTASTASYTLGTDVLDVALDANSNAGVVYTATSAEMSVLAIPRQHYLSITDKTTEGTPTMVYVEKQATTKLLFWPVPAETMTFRYTKVRLPFDSDASATLDLARRWHKSILYAVAWQVAGAKSRPLEVVRDLRSVAGALKKEARSGDSESTHGQMYVESYR